MTDSRIERLFNSLLNLWPQLGNIYPEQSFEHTNRDGVMRIYRSRFKSIECVLQLQSLKHSRISKQIAQTVFLR